MPKKTIAFTVSFVAFLLLILVINHFLPPPPTPKLIRPTVEFTLNPNSSSTPIDVNGGELPEFSLDLSLPKLAKILASEAHIVHTAYAKEIPSQISVDKQKLVVKPQDSPNFKPGKYRLSLKLRTPQGEINLEQDFNWGVLAVNTNKSVYLPGQQVKVGMAVLNNRGDTLCLTGIKKVDSLSLTITSPQSLNQNFSLSDHTITDSGECGAATFTNAADFQAVYTTTTTGIYQMLVTAVVNGETRQITDYFKVENSVEFDIERTSFPTRIYPPSIYPVTFTVTSTRDFNGQITDIVPADFKIQHISDDGYTEKFGDFTHIIWNTSLTADTPKTFTYFIKFPQISPEFYLLGPISVGNFSEARQWQIASDAINSTSGLATWEDNGGSYTWSRIWTGTGWNPPLPTPGVSMGTNPDDSRWFVEKSSPKTAEKLVALIDNSSSGNDTYYMFTWSGSAWTESFTITIGTAAAANITRAFDVAYEELSGDAIFVYSDYSNSQLYYRRRPRGGSWDASSSNAGSAYSTYKRWVRLESQFNSDSILVGYLNSSNYVGAMIWDGTSNTFGDQFSDASGSAAATSADQAYDIAWETASGTPMIFWGTTSNNLVYREFTSGTWQAEATAASGFTNDLAWVKVAADPVSTSNNISLGLQDITACVAHFGVWTGGSATMNGTTYNCASASYNNLIDTKFENSTGKAMWVFVYTSNPNQLSWLTWTSAGSFTSITTETGGTNRIEGIQLYSDLNSTSMITLYHDDNGTQCRLWDREWDGSSWSTFPSYPQEDNLCDDLDNDTEPYGFGFDRNLETLAAYRFFANNNGTDVGSPLTGQDTAYTLTEANQQFRLRLLLYYPDILLTSTGRQYALQYVDPGTGTCASPTGGTPSTWTDVPTSGGQINFYNNLSPADGDNLTANANDPTYRGLTVRNQDYEEADTFTNSVTNMAGDEVGKWDFSLVDNTTYDRDPQTFCFRVVRAGTTDLVLQIGIYPQITTAAVADVLILGDTLIQGGVGINR